MDGKIVNMKTRLSGIMREYRFQNVERFYKSFNKSKEASKSYQNNLQKWEQQYGEKQLPLHDKLKEKEQEIREQQTEQPHRKNKDR